jgi:AraC-like DNA-binding protein
MVTATMTMLPTPALQPFVQQLWWSEATASQPGSREHVLPTGQMHLVFRLSGPMLRIFAGDHDLQGQVMHGPVVGGARSSFYAKELSEPVVSLGVQLRPGAAQLLFGVSAAELAERHTLLSDLWGRRAQSTLDQLCSLHDPQQQLIALQKQLIAQLHPIKALHPAIAQTLAAPQGCSVEDMVRSSQYSHRGFIALFKQATGLSPKRYVRLMRFQQLLACLRAASTSTLAEMALKAGYSDQAHMTREFREFSGVTPMQYLQRMPDAAHHVPLGQR